MKFITYFVQLFLIIIFPVTHILAGNAYPKTLEERKADEMDSILGGEGIIFRPGKIRNESTKNVINGQINKYLWEAAVEILNFVPLNSSDSTGGIIISDWCSPQGHANHSYKFNIFIKGALISPESIEVRTFERTLVNGRWTMATLSSNLSTALEDKIIRKAREIHINASQK